MQDVTEIIRKAREAKGYSQEKAGKLIGLGLRQYQNLEGGKFPKFKRELIVSLERALDISIYKMIYADNGELKDEGKKIPDLVKGEPEKTATAGDMVALFSLLMEKLNGISSNLENTGELTLTNNSLIQSVLVQIARQEARSLKRYSAKEIFESAIRTAEKFYDGMPVDNDFDKPVEAKQAG